MAVLWFALLIVGFLTALISIWLDVRDYVKDRHISGFISTLMVLLFTFIIGLAEYNIQSKFAKPSLLKVYYDGDINGTGIDFKSDGTYILDNSSIGFSGYFYGVYSISGNKIGLDKEAIDNVIESQHLEIKNDPDLNELYLYQTDAAGKILKDATLFRIVTDNRK